MPAMSYLRTLRCARYGRGVPRRPALGQPAPRFELPVHRTDGAAELWSLDDVIQQGRAAVLIFHRHIH